MRHWGCAASPPRAAAVAWGLHLLRFRAMPPRTIDELLLRTRDHLATHRAESEERVTRIKDAADEYLRAVEADLVADFAARAGLEASRSSLALRAALALRSLVEALPEARVKTEVVAEAPEPGGSQRSEDLAPAASARWTETDPEIGALYREFQSANFEKLSDAVFRPSAEELACRARELQARGLSDGGEVLTRIIRGLTAKALQRNIRDVFGLARSHQADWALRAASAHRERERALAAPPPKVTAPSSKVVATRITIPEALRAQVAGALEDDEAGEWPETPRLLALCVERPIVLVGGMVKQEKLERLRRHLGAEVEWVATDGGSLQGIASLERRVREGRIAAVVVLEELVGHRHFVPVAEAARHVGTPLAYGAKAGKASIARALQDLEGMLVRDTSGAES